MIKVKFHHLDETKETGMVVSVPVLPKVGDEFEFKGLFVIVDKVWFRAEKRGVCSVHAMALEIQTNS